MSKAGDNVTVPLWRLDADGAVRPNPLFHRPWDRLHSRCVEYPFTASQIRDGEKLLDVGSSKADEAWLAWLARRAGETHLTDIDPPPVGTDLPYHEADLRNLPIEDETFDCVAAVSVIEHVGLARPQVAVADRPTVSRSGDVEAVRELLRVLKFGGNLILTLPFGTKDGLIFGGEARCYTPQSIRKFEALAKPVCLEYYEYQYASTEDICIEHQPFLATWRKLARRLGRRPLSADMPALPGSVTWRRIPPEQTSARNVGHTDGVLCGVWKK